MDSISFSLLVMVFSSCVAVVYLRPYNSISTTIYQLGMLNKYSRRYSVFFYMVLDMNL